VDQASRVRGVQSGGDLADQRGRVTRLHRGGSGRPGGGRRWPGLASGRVRRRLGRLG
jgi:hypothetical protein